MSNFKNGDKVYFPKRSCKVLTVHGDGFLPYPITLQGRTESFTRDGKFLEGDMTPSIFHATEENHALLEQLYGIEFEAPPVKPTRREIIQAMFKRGDRSVTCWVSDTNENPDSHHTWAFICSVSDKLFIDKDGSAWRFATPFDSRTGEPITELPT